MKMKEENVLFDFISIVGFLACIVCIVMAIVSLIKKNGKAKKFAKGILVAFIIFMVGVINSPSSKIDSSQSTKVSSNKSETSVAATNKAKGEIKEQKENEVKSEESSDTALAGNLKVHYINVGQGDSILIEQGNHSMLIDAGNNGDSELVKNYVVSQGVNSLDFLIGTHPHEDHIGGMDYIINSLKVGKIYMPKATSTTKTFKDVVLAAQNKGVKVTNPTPGASFKLGQATCTMLAPNGSTYKELNDYSIVIKVQFGENIFMFNGDAEATSEMEMVKKGFDLKAHVLKVGHHGSNSSTCVNFLDAVNPEYAVISVGKGNSYGHPSSSTMSRLQAKGIKIFRTDENGTVIAISDGKNIKFNCSPGTYAAGDNKPRVTKPEKSVTKPKESVTSSSNRTNNKAVSKPAPKIAPAPSQNNGQTVYVTKTGDKYHSGNCQYLRKSKIPIKKSQAISQGYGRCSKCRP